LKQVNEFHHAVSNNYKNIINYFTPKFLLGLTKATERLDAKDVSKQPPGVAWTTNPTSPEVQKIGNGYRNREAIIRLPISIKLLS